MTAPKKTTQLHNHKKWNKYLCGFFAGFIMKCPDREVKLLAESNFRRLYKTLTQDEKIELRKEIETVKNTPSPTIRNLINILETFEEKLRDL
jgi:hypothetical protein